MIPAGTSLEKWPWELYIRLGSETVKDWNLPDAVDNPLFGLPALPSGDLPNEPYRYLKWYGREHAHVFFGRGHQIRQLYKRVTDTSSTPVLLFYGQAGVGKSSLLSAGLIPRLEGKALAEGKTVNVAVYERYDPTLKLIGSLRKTITGPNSLFKDWNEYEARQGFPLVMILDQLEEVFISENPEKLRDLEVFLSELTNTFGNPNKRPLGKLVLGFRKEWFAEVEKSLKEKAISFSTLFLKTLDRRGMMEAVTGLTRDKTLVDKYGLVIKENRLGELAETIASDLLEDHDSPNAPTLQILLSKMWQQAKVENESHPTFTLELYQKLKREGILLKDFLDQQLEKIKSWNPEVVQSGLVLDLLAFHTTPLGSSRQRTPEEVAQTYLGNPSQQSQYLKRQELIPDLIEHVKGAKLLTDTSEDKRTVSKHTRLTHDTLAPLVRQRFDTSVAPGQRARRLLQNKVPDWRDGNVGTPLDKRDLDLVEAGASGMPAWNDNEERLVEKSRELKAKREKNQKRLWGAGIAAACLIVLGAGVSLWQWRVAVNERDTARKQEAIAEGQTIIAKQKTKEAEQQANLALSRQLSTQALLAARNPNTLNGFADLAPLLAKQAEYMYPSLETKGGMLKVFQALPPEFRGSLHGHNDIVHSVAFSPDSTFLASGSADGTIVLWDVAHQTPIGQPLVGHTGPIYSVAFSPDGKILATGSEDNTIILWDVSKRRPLSSPLVGHLEWVRGLDFSPDGKLLASASADTTIILWDVVTRKPIASPFKGHKDWVNSVAFSPDGTTLASAGSDNLVILWDVQNRSQLGTLQGHSSYVLGVAFNSSGTILASGSRDKNIILWDVATRTQLGEQLLGHSDSVPTVAFSPDGMTLASGSGDSTIFLWDVETRTRIGEPLRGHNKNVGSVAFSPDRRMLASGSKDKSVILWDLENKSHISKALLGNSDAVTSVVISPDGKTLFSSSHDARILIWDLETLQQVGEPLLGHKDWIITLALSPDGKTLASGSRDQNIILWDVATHTQLGEPLLGHTSNVFALDFSPDGKILASGSVDETIILWDVETHQRIGGPLKGHKFWVNSVDFSPDGKTLVSGSEDKSIMFWDVETRLPLGEPLRGHNEAVTSVVFSPDGKTFASTSYDTTILIWDVESHTVQRRLEGHNSPVNRLAFSPNGKMLASASRDDTVILWDVESYDRIGEPLQRHTESVLSVAFSPDSKTLASSSADKSILLWEVDPEDWLTKACKISGRNFSRAEWQKYLGDIPYQKTCPQYSEGK